MDARGHKVCQRRLRRLCPRMTKVEAMAWNKDNNDKNKGRAGQRPGGKPFHSKSGAFKRDGARNDAKPSAAKPWNGRTAGSKPSGGKPAFAKPGRPPFRPKKLKTALPLPAPADAPLPERKSAERIAKVIARAGLCSRREAEEWIAE